MMRILCLHGANHTSYSLRSDLIQLEQRLYQNHKIELIYVDSPICDDGTYAVGQNRRMQLMSSDDTSDKMNRLAITHQSPCDESSDSLVPMNEKYIRVSSDDKRPQDENEKIIVRKWFNEEPTPLVVDMDDKKEEDDDDAENYLQQTQDSNTGHENKQEKCYYVGMDASILHLIQIWNRELHSRPFRGILAFHQGAALAGILPLLGKKFSGLEFLILADGYVLTPPPCRGCMGLEREMHLEEHIVDGVETLHLIDKNSTRVPSPQSRKLARRFVNSQIHKYSTKDERSFPNRARELNVIGKFIISCKNEMLTRQSKNASLILETQQKLHGVTQNAMQFICSTVALDPPKALMAVIAPNAVGGWSGPKLRDPTDGGGAPCPKEFVMNEEERKEYKCKQSGEKNEYENASREHPKSCGEVE